MHCIVGRLTNVTPFAFILWIVFEEELLEVGDGFDEQTENEAYRGYQVKDSEWSVRWRDQIGTGRKVVVGGAIMRVDKYNWKTDRVDPDRLQGEILVS